MKRIDFENGTVTGNILGAALPMLVAQILNLLYNIVDRIYIARIPEVGTAALGAVGLCFPLIVVITAFANLFGSGGAPLFSIYRGKKKNQEAEQIMDTSFSMVCVSGLILMAIGLLFARPLLVLFGASRDALIYACPYMMIYLIGTLPSMIAVGMNPFINAQGFARTGMLTVTIGAACNIILDPIFIFALGMGVQGAALATILSQGISCAWILRFLTGKTTTLRLQLRYARLRGSVILPCIALGIAPFIMQFTESILNICFNTSLLRYGGDIAVGAMTILASVMQFCMLPLQGLTQGAQPIIGFNFGANQRDRVKEAFRLLLACCMVFAGLIWFLSMFVPQLFISIFTSDPQLADFTRWAIRIYMAVSLLHGIQISCQQTFIALGNAKTSVFLALLRKVILLIPLIYILPYFLADKVFAVFLAEPVADFIAVSTTATLFYRQYKKL